MPDVPELHTRRPTGKPPWPMIVVAGAEKCGKSWSAAEFSASPLIDRTFWCELGEGAADQYGALPGARYEILQHDGSYRGIGRELWAATRQPRGESGKPHAIVVDPVSTLWELLSDEAQGIANARARRAAEKQRRPAPDGDRVIGRDLWNGAKTRWKRVLKMLRTYDGPVILIARLEQISLTDKDGQPTTEKTWKIQGEKNLPFEADAVVRYTATRTAELTGVRSTVLQLEPGKTRPLPDFTIDGLLRELGLAEPDATAPRTYIAPRPDWAEAEADIDGDPADQDPATHRPAAAPRTMTIEDRRAQLMTGLVDRIAASETEEELGKVCPIVDEHVAAGRLRQIDRQILEKAYARRMGELRPTVGEPA